MCLGVQVDGEIFRVLVFDDGLVFGEDLVIEVEGVLQGGVVVEVAAEWDEDAGLARGNGRSGVQNAETVLAWEVDGELGGKR